MDRELIIHGENLTHIYPNGVEALRGVTIDIYRGEYLAIVGQNGSGKTTLAKHLNGLLRPTHGAIIVRGIDAGKAKVSELSRIIGYVFQNPDDMLFCNSIEEEIAFGPEMIGCSKEETKHRVDEIIQVLGLESMSDQHPFALSLGDRQRVAVACALSMEPEVFVFDEPTTGQDYFGGQRIMSIIDQLHASGKTIIIITHDMQMVAEHAQRVVVMSAGQIALDAPPEKAFTQLEPLETLSLRPPQITRFAFRMGWTDHAILNVQQMLAAMNGSHASSKIETGGEAK
ncbi:MAG: ABC transporter ATP-binding protein [Anaerolineales bacterium]|nr:ABC transporter ATP-binding protein [Anaerolineales bacterium]